MKTTYTFLSRQIVLIIALFIFSNKANAVISLSPTSATMCQTGTAQVAFVNGCHHYTSNYPIANLSTITTSGFINISPPSGLSYPAVVTFTITGYNVDNTVCGSINYTLTVNTGPSFTLSTTTPAICQSQSASISLVGPTTASYSWNPNNGVYSTSSSTKSVFPDATTVYTVTGTQSGCTSTKNITITVNNTPIISPSISNITICKNEAAELKISNSSSPISTYNFSPNTDVASIGTNQFSLSPSTTMTYTISATGTNGCVSKQKTVQVNVNSNPNVSIVSSNGTSITSGSTTNLTASGATSYMWACNSTLSSTVSSTVTATPTATSTEYVVYGTNGTCSDDAAIIIATTSSSESVQALSTNATPCVGTSTILNASATGSPTSYTWSPSTYLSSTNSMSVVCTPTAPITYTVIAHYADGSQVSDVIDVAPQVIVSPTITSSTGSNAVCPGSNISLTVVEQSGTTYSWSPATSLNTTSGSMVTASPSSSIIYTVTATNANGCSSTDYIAINTINTTPITSNLDNTYIDICENDGMLMMLQGGSSYNWSPSNSVTEYMNSNNSQVFLTPSTTTNYTVSTTDANGCVVSANYFVHVRPKPIITLPDTLMDVYSGELVTLTASGNASIYVWKDFFSDEILGEGTSIQLATTEDKAVAVFGLDEDSKCFDSERIDLNVTTLKSSELNSAWELYPNPSEGALNIVSDNTILNKELYISLYDLTGKLIWSETQNPKGFLKSSYDFKYLAGGTYLIKISSSEGELKSFKWTKL